MYICTVKKYIIVVYYTELYLKCTQLAYLYVRWCSEVIGRVFPLSSCPANFLPIPEIRGTFRSCTVGMSPCCCLHIKLKIRIGQGIREIFVGSLTKYGPTKTGPSLQNPVQALARQVYISGVLKSSLGTHRNGRVFCMLFPRKQIICRYENEVKAPRLGPVSIDKTEIS